MLAFDPLGMMDREPTTPEGFIHLVNACKFYVRPATRFASPGYFGSTLPTSLSYIGFFFIAYIDPLLG